MSTLTHRIAVIGVPFERRFYARVAPSTLIHLAIGPDKQASLLNLSENGLLVSAPHGLAINSVHRVSLSFSDLPKQIPNSIANSINVHVRTIWTAASQKIAGLQFLDLSEIDRDKIRKWADLQSSENNGFESWTTPKNTELTRKSGTPSLLVELQANAQYATAPEAPPSSDVALQAGDAGIQEICSRETTSRHDNSAVRTTTPSSAPVLIFWSIALATILLVTGWASGHNLDKSLIRSAHSQKTSASESEATSPASTQAVLEPTAAPTASGNSHTGAGTQDIVRQDVAQQDDAAELAPTDNSTDTSASLPPIPENSTIEPSVTKSPLAKPKSPRPKLANPNLSAASTRPYEPQAPLKSTPIVVESTPPRTSPAIATSAPQQTPTSSESPSALRNGSVTGFPVSPNTAANNAERPATNPPRTADPTQPSVSASNPFPKTLSVDMATSQSSNSSGSNSTRSSVFPASKPTQRASISAPGTVFPSASGVNRSVNASRAASPPETKPNNPDAKREVQPKPQPEVQPEEGREARPDPTIFELPASSSASFVNLPGERILQSPGVTMHVQRSVWMRAGHWFWHGRKKVALGALSSRVDPKPSHSASPSGTIAVQATIDEQGRVTSLKPLYGSLAYLPSVSRAVRDWRYEPTYVDNRPVETLAKIEVNFHSTSSRAYRP